MKFVKSFRGKQNRVEEEYTSLLGIMGVRDRVVKGSLLRSRSSTATITPTYLAHGKSRVFEFVLQQIM